MYKYSDDDDDNDIVMIFRCHFSHLIGKQKQKYMEDVYERDGMLVHAPRQAPIINKKNSVRLFCLLPPK